MLLAMIASEWRDIGVGDIRGLEGEKRAPRQRKIRNSAPCKALDSSGCNFRLELIARLPLPTALNCQPSVAIFFKSVQY
jgi:hypothetical protein